MPKAKDGYFNKMDRKLALATFFAFIFHLDTGDTSVSVEHDIYEYFYKLYKVVLIKTPIR